MYNHLLYFTYWLVNFIVLFVFYYFFPDNVVLGNWRFGVMESAVYSAFWVTFFVWVLWDFAMAKGIKFDNSIVTLGYFWSANIFAFWLVSRFSHYTGFGITNYAWAILVALLAYFLQRLGWKIVVGK